MKFMYAVLATIMLASTSGCKADEGFKSIRYSVKSYERWPIIAFLESSNLPQSSALHPSAMARNSGYSSSDAGIPARNFKLDRENPYKLSFSLTWYEYVTRKSYFSEFLVDTRDLKPDPIQSDFGLLIFRISRMGDLQVVTYDESSRQTGQPATAIIIERICAKEITLTDENKTNDLKRLLDQPLIMEGMAFHARPKDIPSDCN